MLSLAFMQYSLQPEVKSTGFALSLCMMNFFLAIFPLIVGALETDESGKGKYRKDFIFWVLVSTVGIIASITLFIIDRYEGGILNARNPIERRKELQNKQQYKDIMNENEEI